MKHLAALITMINLLIASSALTAGELVVPHQPGDKVMVYVHPSRYAHPVDYWWHKEPSMQGNWDYFTPVEHINQPVLLETQPGKEQSKLAPAIPVTHRPFR